MVQTGVRDIVEDLSLDDRQADVLIAKYIRQDANQPGRHEAWVEAGQTGTQVWLLIPYLRASGLSDVAQTYNLPEDALVAAVAYYRRHRDLIDARILLDSEERFAS